jgi:predicted metal-dependent peptidase
VWTGKPRPAFEPALQRIGHRPRIVVAVDTSGSISSTTLALFASEINGITRKTNAETHILCFDEEVYAHHETTPLTLPNVFEGLTFRRGGGTSFARVLRRADALSPSVIVMLTDGEGHFGQAPAERVIWASPRPLRTAPPFGDCVELVR